MKQHNQKPFSSTDTVFRRLGIVIVALFFCGPVAAEAIGQRAVKLYPSVVRVKKGETKTITAAAYDSPTNPVFSATFTEFSPVNTAIAETSPVLVSGDDISVPVAPPPNLRTVTGKAAGVTTITAFWNGTLSNIATIIVDDPELSPTAIIAGDNEAFGGSTVNTRVGEAIELDAEFSRGVERIEWNWGDGDRTTDLLSVTHAYLSPGTYPVVLSITNKFGQTASQSIFVNVSAHPQPTQVIYVNTIAELLVAFNNATGGEHIVIPAGTVLLGEIVLPAKNFSDYVTIRSSAVMPDIHQRIDPNHPGLVTMRGTHGNAIPLTISNGSTKVRLSGVKFDPKYIHQSNGPSTYYLVQIGDAFTQNDVSENPTKIIMEHCVVNPPDDVNVVHAVLNDGYKVSIISSWLGNVKTHGGQDSQAVVSYDGRGAHVYHNTFFEAASENVMYGGVVPNIEGLTSKNIEFRRSYFSKRLSWREYVGESHPVNVKNLFETKNARRVYIESTVFENHWDGWRSQRFAFVFKSATSPGMPGEFVPWAISEDIVMENNEVSHVFGGITSSIDNYWMGPFHGLKPNNVIVKNTVFDDLSNRWGGPSGGNGGRFVQPNNLEDLKIDHVTVIDKDQTAGTAILFVSNNNFRFSVTNSVFGLGGYGIHGGGVGTGIRALNPGTAGALGSCTKAAEWHLENNVMPFYGENSSCYPSTDAFNNFYPQDYNAVGFADLAGGDYRLAPWSEYKSQADNGVDPGANIPLLNERIACSVSGNTAPCLSGVSVPVPTFVRVTGRVMNGQMRGVPGAIVAIASPDGNRRNAITNGFGYFVFENVETGQHTFSVASRGLSYLPVVRTISDNVTDLNFLAAGSSIKK